jgi:hypothetical protein
MWIIRFGSKKALHSGLSPSYKIVNNPSDSFVSGAFVHMASSGSLKPAMSNRTQSGERLPGRGDRN